ncbi:MAG: hypothetical protein SGPRY_002699 [Prymnesium sp.]
MAPPLHSLSCNYGQIVFPVRTSQPVRGEDATASSIATEPTKFSAFELAVGAMPDPILSLRDEFLLDETTGKLNLAIGVYRTSEGDPYVLPSVKKAETLLLHEQASGLVNKEYLPADGMQAFCDESLRLLLGSTIDPALAAQRVVSAQSLSGTGGLHLAACMLAQMLPGATVYLPAPTWPIHPEIFTNVGLRVASYPYYDRSKCGLDEQAMLGALRSIPSGPCSVVLLHACGHNPTGVDPSMEQWKTIAEVLHSRGLLPLVDSAYQGLVSGDLWKDGAGARCLSQRCSEMLICQSYSKNMGLYAERAGVFSMVCADRAVADRVRQQLKRTVRLTYSSPPHHGAAIAFRLLSVPELREQWGMELRAMASRLRKMRYDLSAALERQRCPPPQGTSLTTWSHVLSQCGMFTYTGLTSSQVSELRDRYHIYIPVDGRIAMASLTTGACDKLACAIKDVVTSDETEEPPAKRQLSESGDIL